MMTCPNASSKSSSVEAPRKLFIAPATRLDGYFLPLFLSSYQFFGTQINVTLPLAHHELVRIMGNLPPLFFEGDNNNIAVLAFSGH